MQLTRRGSIKAVFLMLLCFMALPSAMASDSRSDTKRHTCRANHEHTLQRAIDKLDPGDTLIVRGICKENVVIGEGRRNISIVGEPGATIDGSGNPNASTVQIRGRRITLKGFTIIGGRHGVQVNNGGTVTVDGNLIKGASTHGVIANNNGFALIVNNVIENNGSNGICICEHSVADIGFRGDFATAASPNTVRNNGGNGILVADASYAEIESNAIYGNSSAGISLDNNASAKIGYQAGVAGTFASANTIEFNGNRGVVVSRSSSARIVENNIRSNTGAGVGIFRGSQADVASNVISNNTAQGIFVSQNSGANLGNTTGATPQDLPNAITNNGGLGIQCVVNSYLSGRHGNPSGNLPPDILFDVTCASSLSP